MERLIHVLGLQRSGTNYLSELCRLNLSGAAVLPSGDRTVCWKHALPGEIGRNASHTGLAAGEALLAHPELFALLIAKHPFNWIASIRRRPADIFIKRPALAPGGEPDIAGLMDLYRDFYGGWVDLLSARGGYLLIHYEATLGEPSAALAAIAKAAGLPAPKAVETPLKAPFSKTFREADRKRYADFDHGLSPRDLAAAQGRWPAHLLERMGYGAALPETGRAGALGRLWARLRGR